MKLYPRLALEGMRKNKRLYIPYVLTGCIMVMMYYILSFLSESPALSQMQGGSILMTLLPMGSFVIAAFSVLFLFYTNAFLIRQRYREFGLYNVLGMDKRHIGRIMAWEGLFVAALVILTGLVAGVALSKAAELVLLNLLNMSVTFTLHIGLASLLRTALLYGIIYLLLLLASVLRVRKSRPLELMKMGQVGERIPKYTGLLGLLGVLLLAAAYSLAVSIREPLTAFVLFFVAVLLVIAGTYLLFMAGSVTFCQLLKRNKRYYYQPSHFVSVSSMVYRMKRNGAGLASICILLTMVLVMISATTSLYFGAEDSLRLRCPNSINLSLTFDTIDGISDQHLDALREQIQPHSGPEADLTGVRIGEVPGFITQEGILINPAHAPELSLTEYDRVGYLAVLSLRDYNRITGQQRTLEPDECLVYGSRLDFRWDSFTMEYGQPYRVKEQLDAFQVDGYVQAMVNPVVYLVVDDLGAFAAPVQGMANAVGDPMMMFQWKCGFDVDTPEQEAQVRQDLYALFRSLGDDGTSYSVASRQVQRASFYDMYGSLFFLGLMLSIVFLLAAVLIIYYKQICEGYEDQARFGIMQKVGMTKRDIRKSINSQMLTVFFLPLGVAGVHLAFSFPFVMKIFRMFAFDNTLLGILVNLACFVAFGVLYALVYKLTSGAYYAIVSGKRAA